MSGGETIRRVAPPVAAVLVLVLAGSMGGLRARELSGAEAYHARVAEAIDAMPADFEDWRSFDIPPQPAAQELLKPNRVVQRQFRHRLSDNGFGVLVVHCRDARDMRGHYPPVCYPASGWSLVSAGPAEVELAGGRHPAREYHFERRVRGLDQTLSVLNFFILPGGEETVVVAGMDELMRARQTRIAPGLGAAQVQVLGLAELPSELRREALAIVSQQIRPMARVIAEGTNDE